MTNVVQFRRREGRTPIPSGKIIEKIVDGKPIEVVILDGLSAEELAAFFAKEEAAQ